VSARHKVYNSRDARKYWSARLPLPCSRCGGVVDGRSPWHVDHLVRLSEGGSPNDRRTQWPAHAACNTRDGQKVGQQRQRARKNADKRTNFLDL
jgi:5-methylcytosine-specific restriction endonuclease McrA